MDWLTALLHLREANEPAVVATVATVRGHAPRDPGAKLVVTALQEWGTVGGGNVEATVLDRARELLMDPRARPEVMSFTLSDKAATVHGVQCCGGEVTVLLEPMPARRTIAIFGVGHVGYEIARILSRHSVRLLLVDTRETALTADRVESVSGGLASLRVHHTAAPEKVMEQLPADASVFILTHDHAEDMILCDTALRLPLSYVGLIGSSAKASRFRKELTRLGHTVDEVERIVCPIGLSQISAKDPASIAVGVVADLLARGLV